MSNSVAPSARILVAEDEEQLRELTAEILSGEGYEVVTADNGDDAMSLLAADRSIALLLTDIKMPGALDGWALARAARSLRPDLRVIYMTAYATLPPEGTGASYGPVLRKPWRPTQLLSCIRQTL